MTAKVMVVEDERIVAFNLQQRLSKLGYDVPAIAASGEEALRLAQSTRPDLVLMDIRIQGDIDGIDTAAQLNSIHPVPVVYLTAYSEDATLERARATRPYGYLLKPFSEREMHATIQMALERHSFEGVLHESEQRLRLALEASEMGIVEVDPLTREVALAGRSAKIFGLEESRAKASCDALLDCVDQSDRERVREELERSLRELSQYQIEFRRTTHDGDLHWVRAQGRNVSRFSGKTNCLLGVVQDVTDRKAAEERMRKLNEHLEREVALRTAELEASNAELDAFSYTVAHDLRSPVRAIIGFSETLSEACGQFLDEEGSRYLSRVHAAGVRMAEMIDALLKLAHISRVELRRSEVDLSAIAAAILQELRDAEPQRVVNVFIAKELRVNADPDLARIVLDNLLRNAWKFTSKRALANIEFGMLTSEATPVYFVRDDGAGFEMTYKHRLFGAFQRLHRADDFPGTGVGLATVQRIVQRHGGKAWATGAPDQGATFHFTLPA